MRINVFMLKLCSCENADEDIAAAPNVRNLLLKTSVGFMGDSLLSKARIY